ncbi:MAG: BolA family protein [Gammaproteobacteria bacterium WSBS_2016_MAG_OTU1]
MKNNLDNGVSQDAIHNDKGEAIRQLLAERLRPLSPENISLFDESHLHRGHREAGNGGHFRLKIVSPQFAGKTLLQRHRIVYAAIGDLATAGLHALSIRAYSPEEYLNQQETPS